MNTDIDLTKLSFLLDYHIIEEQVNWLSSLPNTRTGKMPYKITQNFSFVHFVRSEDATAFKLKFKV